MCMITHIPGGVPIPVEGITNGSYTNQDGHGWAVASRHGLQVGKSMDFNEALDGLIEAREKHGKSSLALFHSRFATHGVLDEFNVHPFWADIETVVAHNGILPQQWLPKKGDLRSDTRVLVDETLPAYITDSGIPSRRGGRELGKRIGTGNKLVILSSKGGVPRVRIVNAHLGEHADGVWYSNSGYLPSLYSYGTDWKDWKGWKDDDIDLKGWLTDEQCDVCFSRGSIEMDTGWCKHCHFCSVCYATEEHCGCAWNQRQLTGTEFWGDEEFEAANRAANALIDNGLDFGPVIG